MSLMWQDTGYKLPPEAYEEVMRVYEEGYFVPHRHNPLWTSAVLHGATWYETNTPDNYGKDNADDYHWTEISELCPNITKFFKDEFIFENYSRVRFMCLEPGGKIPLHHDANTPERREAALASFQRGAINACITNPEGCFIRDAHTGEDVPWTPGDIFWFNCWRDHFAENNSNEPRFHMVIHGKRKRRGT